VAPCSPARDRFNSTFAAREVLRNRTLRNTVRGHAADLPHVIFSEPCVTVLLSARVSSAQNIEAVPLVTALGGPFEVGESIDSCVTVEVVALDLRRPNTDECGQNESPHLVGFSHSVVAQDNGEVARRVHPRSQNLLSEDFPPAIEEALHPSSITHEVETFPAWYAFPLLHKSNGITNRPRERAG
jgi:hypothetical protein